MRKFARLLALVLVATTSVIGLINIPDELRSQSDTGWQRSVTIGGALHGVLGLLLVYAALRKRSWAVAAAVGWAVAVTYTAAVASFAWSDIRDSGVLIGVIAAAVACGLLGWWAIWAARESATRHIPASSETASPRQ